MGVLYELYLGQWQLMGENRFNAVAELHVPKLDILIDAATHQDEII
jgi:hypothetical protein